MKLIYLDTETTGIDEGARLVQLAYKDRASNKEVNEYFKPPVPISFGAMATHHITAEFIEDKPGFEGSSAKKNLIEALEGSILVAHNAKYDIMVLENEGVHAKRYVDTLRVAQHLVESEQYKLQYLRYSLGLKVDGKAHDASGDILVLEALFGYLGKTIREKFPVNSEEEVIQKMIELTELPVLLKTFNFGKYKGKAFEEVGKSDQGYLQWLYSSETQKKKMDQNEELIYTLNEYINSKR